MIDFSSVLIRSRFCLWYCRNIFFVLKYKLGVAKEGIDFWSSNDGE